MEETPLISVVVIAYRSGRTIVETLDSILRQSWPRVELIVSDDGSDDETLPLCRGWMAEFGERFERAELLAAERNAGISANANRGVRASAGQWVKVIAGDDLLEPQALERFYGFVRRTGRPVVFSRMKLFADGGEVPERLARFFEESYALFRCGYTARQQYEILRYARNFCPAPAAFFSRGAWERAGGYDESVALAEDLPFWLRVTEQGQCLSFLDEALVDYRVGTGSVQRSARFEVTKRLLKYKYLLGLRRSVFYAGISQLDRCGSLKNRVLFGLLAVRTFARACRFRRTAARMPELYGLEGRRIIFG